MTIYLFIFFLLGVATGILIERYRWTRASKTGKSIGVDGLFYRVRRFDPDAPTEVQHE